MNFRAESITHLAASSTFLTYLAAINGHTSTANRMKIAQIPRSRSVEFSVDWQASIRLSVTQAWNSYRALNQATQCDWTQSILIHSNLVWFSFGNKSKQFGIKISMVFENNEYRNCVSVAKRYHRLKWNYFNIAITFKAKSRVDFPRAH